MPAGKAAPRRRRLPFVLLAILAIGLALVVDVWLIEPNWIEVTHHQLTVPIARPLTIAHVTDLHTRGLGWRERRLLALLERERPDVIMVTGDTVVDGGTSAGYQDVLSRLHAPLGVWAVRGNWENWIRIKPEREFYQATGVRLLVNLARPIRDDVWVVGFDDAATGRPNLEGTLSTIPKDVYTIALFHSPGFFERLAGRCPLSLAGHTHGGQVRIPWRGPLWLPRGCGRFVAGWYERGGSRLYVSRGIGMSIVPIRFWCRPELAIIRLELDTSSPAARTF